jgi:hypothetical protein
MSSLIDTISNLPELIGLSQAMFLAASRSTAPRWKSWG